MKNILAPSMLAADFNHLEQDIKEIERGGATWLHIDVMDGHFVPSISFGMPVIESIKRNKSLVFDTHLMIEKPDRYLEEFVKAGSDYITVHLEACEDAAATLRQIRAMGVKSGLSIKPKTPVESIEPYLPYTDMILIMCVEPGFGGQKYIPESTKKIRMTREMIEKSGYDIHLEVDGGIKINNVKEVLEAGANVIVAGSAVFGEDIVTKTREFMSILDN